MEQASISSHVEHAGFERTRVEGLGDLGPATGILLGLGLSLIFWQALILLVLWVVR